MHKPKAEIHEDGTTITVIASKHRPRNRAPHPVAVYSHDDENGRSWTVEHHHHDAEPSEHHFTDGHELLAHVANHIGVPAPESPEGENEGYE
ncbi:MAG TPA: hypothetical protein VK466_07575 [Terriglobales bacterium]|nr:hypothetical protein [Terriglobales bacterium]